MIEFLMRNGFLMFFLSLFAISAANGQTESMVKQASTPIPLNISSNLIEGDVSPLFIEEVGLAGVVPSSLIAINTDFSDTVFIVDKTARSLGVWQFQKGEWIRIGYYPTDIGKKRGNKVSNGDHKTPEGIYFLISQKNDEELDFKTYGSRAFVTNYPNLFDRRARKTGSGIWLHAVPDSTPLTRGSRGCVVVRDRIIKEVTQWVSLKRTPIIIKERESYVSTAESEAIKQQLLTWLESWRSSWEAQDITNYMQFYSKTEFRSQGKNWSSWERYKSSLANRYQEQKIEISQPSILAHGNQVVMQFTQDYQADGYSDFGVKTLYIKREDGQHQIVAEEWSPDTPEIQKASQKTNAPTQVGALAKPTQIEAKSN